MRRLLPALAAASGLALGASAEAQFANHGIGLSAGYLSYGVAGTPTGLRGGPHVSIDFNIYIEHGLDLYGRAMFGFCPDSASGGDISVPIFGTFGLRYLFIEESFQPYAGIGFHFVWFTFHQPDFQEFLFGFSPTLGFQCFINSDWSIGLSGQYLLSFAPHSNFPVFHGLGIFAHAATHF